MKRIPVAGKACQAVALELDVVVIVEVVDADDLWPAAKQAQRSVHADEAGGAGEEDFQVGRLQESGALQGSLTVDGSKMRFQHRYPLVPGVLLGMSADPSAVPGVANRIPNRDT
jgi:hypothetical protein